MVLSLLDRHPRPESWLLGGENTADKGGGRGKREKNTAAEPPTRSPRRRERPGGCRGPQDPPQAAGTRGPGSDRPGWGPNIKEFEDHTVPEMAATLQFAVDTKAK